MFVKKVNNDGMFVYIVVSSGTISINDDSSVQILAEESARLEDLDAEV